MNMMSAIAAPVSDVPTIDLARELQCKIWQAQSLATAVKEHVLFEITRSLEIAVEHNLGAHYLLDQLRPTVHLAETLLGIQDDYLGQAMGQAESIECSEMRGKAALRAAA